APASAASIGEAEEGLGIALPAELKELLSECNGISGRYGPELVWSAERLLKANIEFRTFPDFRELYMPFDCLLFFGDNGGGDQFAYRILDRVIRYEEIYRWEHESDSRVWEAGSLQSFFQRWFSKAS